jgi:hypothetical protein
MTFKPIRSYFLAARVEMPKGRYKGQKLIKLVRRKTTAKMTKTSPKVPETVPVKYNKAIVAARITRMARSADPMFFFILGNFML